MRRDLAILDEMIDAAEQAHAIGIDADPATLSQDRMRRDALLWNLTVLGEGAGQISEELTRVHPGLPWRKPTALRNRIVHGYWSIEPYSQPSSSAPWLVALLADTPSVNKPH